MSIRTQWLTPVHLQTGHTNVPRPVNSKYPTPLHALQGSDSIGCPQCLQVNQNAAMGSEGSWVQVGFMVVTYLN